MPTVLLVRGWRIFFYADEGTEPVHVHARKGESQCKMWLRPDIYEVEEAWAHNLSPRLRREVRKVIFDHFDLILDEWRRLFGGTDHAGN
jgi:hypothetical protein